MVATATDQTGRQGRPHHYDDTGNAGDRADRQRHPHDCGAHVVAAKVADDAARFNPKTDHRHNEHQTMTYAARWPEAWSNDLANLSRETGQAGGGRHLTPHSVKDIQSLKRIIIEDTAIVTLRP